MSEIKAGTVAYIKATDEPAFVLAIQQGPTEHVQGFKVDGPVAWVRRPRAGNDGVQHTIELFHLMELEPLEDGQNRKADDEYLIRRGFLTGARDKDGNLLGEDTRNLIEAIVVLPDNLFYGTTIPGAIVFFNRII